VSRRSWKCFICKDCDKQRFVNTSALQQSVFISDNYTNPIVPLNKERDVLLWLASLIELHTQGTTCVLTVQWTYVVPQTIQYLYNVSCQRPERNKKKIPNVWNTTDKKVVPWCKHQQISIIIITELLRNSNDSETYGLAWLPSWVVLVWSVSPETDSTTDRVDGTISISPQNWEPSGKNSALQTFSKDCELFFLT
jgi:hypothetical protein